MSTTPYGPDGGVAITTPTPPPAPPVDPNVAIDTPYAWRTLPTWPISLVVDDASPTFNQGYDVNINTIVGDRRAFALAKCNAWLSDGKYKLGTYVAAINIDSAISGTTGQSQYTRDWYAHNFVQPNFTVIGWSLDQNDYGRLCEFIRYCQWESVHSQATLTELIVAGGGHDGDRPGDDLTRAIRVTNPMVGRTSDPLILDPNKNPMPGSAPPGTYYNQTIRGGHQPTDAKGYVSKMPRIHKQFQGAVQWELEFTVVRMIAGLYQEAKANSQAQTPQWLAMLADAKAPGGSMPINAALLAENKAALAYAASNASSLIIDPSLTNAGPGSDSTTPGTPTPTTPTVIDQLLTAAATINNQNWPYEDQGGLISVGHADKGLPGGVHEGGYGTIGYDCYGAVGAVLYLAGLLYGPLNSNTPIHTWIREGLLVAGEGTGTPECTFFGMSNHIFMRINGKFWGTSDGANHGPTGPPTPHKGGGGWISNGVIGPNITNTGHIPASKLAPPTSGGGTGTKWKVWASAEDRYSGTGWTELSSNGNGAATAGHTQSPQCTGGSVGACDFATLGQAFPHGTQLIITNPSTNQSGTFPLTDVGNGSSFAPAIGLTPACRGPIARRRTR